MQKGKFLKVPPLLICFHLKLKQVYPFFQVLLILVLLDLQVLVSLVLQVVCIHHELFFLKFLRFFQVFYPSLLISTLPQQQCKLRHRLGPPRLTRCQLQIIIPPLPVLLQVLVVLVNLCIKPQLFSKQLKFLRVFYPFLLLPTLPQQQCKLRHRLGPPRITNRFRHSWQVPIPGPPRQFTLKRLLTRIILLKLQLGISYFF